MEVATAAKSVAFYTLGCKLNFSETSTIARSFKDEGFDRVDFNVCTLGLSMQRISKMV